MKQVILTKTDAAEFKKNLILAGDGARLADILPQSPDVQMAIPTNQPRVPLEEFQLEGMGPGRQRT